MNDAELLAAFENCTLPADQWTHRAHVRVAFLYASTGPLEAAIASMRAGIKAFNRTNDVADAVDSGYHETITVAFMTLVFAANLHDGPYASSKEFCDGHPELLAKQALLKHYSRDRILTVQAKEAFVEPDLRPLPSVK